MTAQKENAKFPIFELDYELIKTYENKSLKEEAEKKKNPKKNEINYITVSPDQKYVIAGYTSGLITIFDTKTTEVVKSFTAHKGKVQHIEFYVQENKMLTCGADGTIFIFELEDFNIIDEIHLPYMSEYPDLIEIRFALVSKNMEKIYFGVNNACLYVCEKKSNYKPRIVAHKNSTYPSEPYCLTSGIFSPDKKYVVFSSGYSIKFVNIETDKIDKIFGNTDDYINDVVFHPLNDNVIVSWSEDGTITYWNVETEKKLTDFSSSNEHGPCHVCFDRTGTLLASGNDKNYINIWDATTKHHLAKISDKRFLSNNNQAHNGIIKSLLFTNENELLTGSYDGTAKLWKLIKK